MFELLALLGLTLLVAPVFVWQGAGSRAAAAIGRFLQRTVQVFDEMNYAANRQRELLTAWPDERSDRSRGAVTRP